MREKVHPEGEMVVEVDQDNKKIRMPLMVTPRNGSALMGCSWFHHIPIEWPSCAMNNLSFKEEFSDLFKNELGTLKGVVVNVIVQKCCQPRFFKPHSLPFAMQAKVEAEFDCLASIGVLSPVNTSKMGCSDCSSLKGQYCLYLWRLQACN